MRLPIRPLRLIREFCAFRQVGYCRKTTRRSQHGFYVSSTRYELVQESGIIVVSSLAGAFPDDVIVLDPPPHSLGKVDEEHAVTLAHHAGIALVRVYRISESDKGSWSLVSSVMGNAADQWEIYSAHRSGISILSRNHRIGTSCLKVMDWDWRNDRVVHDYGPYYYHPNDESLILEKVHGTIYYASWCQIRNTRFLDEDTVADLDVRSEMSVDLGGTSFEIHVNVRDKESGRLVQRIPICDSTPWSVGTTHILEAQGSCAFSSSPPRSFPIYIQTRTSIGFMILDRFAATVRSFKLEDMTCGKEEGPCSKRSAAIARLGGDAVVEWLRWLDREMNRVCVSSLFPIEIDGEGDEWVRLAMFGSGGLHYVVDICLRTWRATLLGFFRLRDKASVPLGMVHYADPNVDILHELEL
jgi:hypothetical protein